MKLVIIALTMLIFFSGCDRGRYYDTGPVLVDKQLIDGRQHDAK